jgi:hypothetical protein
MQTLEYFTARLGLDLVIGVSFQRSPIRASHATLEQSLDLPWSTETSVLSSND